MLAKWLTGHRASPPLTSSQCSPSPPSPTLSTTPSGAYSGSKSVLGLTINVNVNVNDGSVMDFHLGPGGQVTIGKAEKYAYDGASSITLPDQGTAGDCIHDAEAAQHVTLVGVDYDAAADRRSAPSTRWCR